MSICSVPNKLTKLQHFIRHLSRRKKNEQFENVGFFFKIAMKKVSLPNSLSKTSKKIRNKDSDIIHQGKYLSDKTNDVGEGLLFL
jgi:hypothetical protein